jgi:hypothetical protein
MSNGGAYFGRSRPESGGSTTGGQEGRELYVFSIIFVVRINYFPLEYSPIGVSNGSALCFL